MNERLSPTGSNKRRNASQSLASRKRRASSVDKPSTEGVTESQTAGRQHLEQRETGPQLQQAQPANGSPKPIEYQSSVIGQDHMSATSPALDINQIISALAMPKTHTVAVESEFSNSNSALEGVRAYAKLAGSSWTYYVRSLSVVIGRRSDPNEQEQIHIDLGPAKVVSRKHATIDYNMKNQCWELTVNGRNGVKVDRISYKECTVQLYSGNILEIGGVQMMFVLPDVAPTVNEAVVKRILESHDRQSQGQRQDSQLEGRGQSYQGYLAQAQLQEQSQQLMQVHQIQPFSQIPNLAPPQSSGQVSEGAYPKGVQIITRPQVRGVSNFAMDRDLSNDDAKDIKPPYSYATMITQAILSTDEMMMSLADIYDWIAKRYSFYRHSKSGWQNSIRHNLSLSKAFEKVPRKKNEPGKGMKWRIAEKFRDEYTRKAIGGDASRIGLTAKQSTKDEISNHTATLQFNLPPARPVRTAVAQPASSVKAEPSPKPAKIRDADDRESFAPPSINSFPLNSDGDKPLEATPSSTKDFNFVFSPSSTSTSFGASQISQLEAYTPERGSRNSATPGGSSNAQFNPRLQLAPPSAGHQQLPSSLMNFSPAPFWKFISNTPSRGSNDFSPSKFMASSPPSERPDSDL